VSDFIAERIWPDARVERSIFGTDDPKQIWARALRACPDAVDCFAFRVSVGALFGLRLRDGSRVALKIHGDRIDDRYLAAMQRVQRHLWEGGFPCPKPLGVGSRATIEEWVDAGEYRDAHEPAVRRVLAKQLSELVRSTSELHPLERMRPFFPTLGEALWPKPHNVLFDFEATSEGAAWIDEIARAAKARRDASPGRLVIAHGDWAAGHFRFEGLRPTVVYDWDSLATDHEPVFVGGAAASFTYTEHVPVLPWPDLDEAKAFLGEYEQARGTAFTDRERGAAQAAVVYARGYTTRCVHALGNDTSALELAEFAAALL
jgi:Phosphotransferase enzyme family